MTCVWCSVPRDKLGAQEKFALRTSESARAFAHLPPLDENGECDFTHPFNCPKCNPEPASTEGAKRRKHKPMFPSKAHWEADHVTDEQANLFAQHHAGHVWHRPSMLLDPSRAIMCILHLRLSLCSSLWTWPVLIPASLDRSPEVCKAVLKQLSSDGVNVWRLLKLHDTSDKAVRNASFTGSAADKIMTNLEVYLDLLQSKYKDEA